MHGDQPEQLDLVAVGRVLEIGPFVLRLGASVMTIQLVFTSIDSMGKLDLLDDLVDRLEVGLSGLRGGLVELGLDALLVPQVVVADVAERRVIAMDRLESHHQRRRDGLGCPGAGGAGLEPQCTWWNRGCEASTRDRNWASRV